MQALDEFGHGIGIPAGFDFDPERVVAHPAGQLEFLRQTEDEGAETDPLDDAAQADALADGVDVFVGVHGSGPISVGRGLLAPTCRWGSGRGWNSGRILAHSAGNRKFRAGDTGEREKTGRPRLAAAPVDAYGLNFSSSGSWM